MKSTIGKIRIAESETLKGLVDNTYVESTMECTTYIANLPCELRECIHNHVARLRAPIKVLPDELKCDIESYSLIGPIERNYKQVCDTQYVIWMENALISLLNDERGLHHPFNEHFHNMFPGSTDDEIKSKLLSGGNLYRLWNTTPSNIRHKMYVISCDMLVRHI